LPTTLSSRSAQAYLVSDLDRRRTLARSSGRYTDRVLTVLSMIGVSMPSSSSAPS